MVHQLSVSNTLNVCPTNFRYVGAVVRGRLEGPGEYFCRSGDCYKGEFLDGWQGGAGERGEAGPGPRPLPAVLPFESRWAPTVAALMSSVFLLPCCSNVECYPLLCTCRILSYACRILSYACRILSYVCRISLLQGRAGVRTGTATCGSGRSRRACRTVLARCASLTGTPCPPWPSTAASPGRTRQRHALNLVAFAATFV